MPRLVTAWAPLDLVRFPPHRDETTRGWDAADEYLLRHLADSSPKGTVVVLGDRWGALSVALSAHPDVRSVVQISDSHLAQEGTRENLKRAGLSADLVAFTSALDPVPPQADMLLVRIPRNLAFLEDQLRRLAPALLPHTVVVAAGLVREVHTSTIAAFERAVGPTRTSPAWKKARLIFADRDPGRTPDETAWPLTYALPAGIGVMSGRTVVNYAGIFCSDRLDVGTRLLLQHVPARAGVHRIVDLGCGNGVLGTAAALANPDAELIFTDESHHAVASAEATFRTNLGQRRTATFVVSDCMAGFPSNSIDMVLCNPPFHTHTATSDDIAWRMFGNARRVLAPEGQLLVVGNRHLGYHSKLRYLFGNCLLVASNPRFVVLSATKRGAGRPARAGRTGRA